MFFSLVCPTNCSGRGRCNFETHKCECFDADDTSETCANSPWLGAAAGVNNDIIGSTAAIDIQDTKSSSSSKMDPCLFMNILCYLSFWFAAFVILY